MLPEVRHTREFDRVAALPRRRPEQADADAWATVLSEELRHPGARVSLRPWQGFCLAEGARVRGGWFALPVGFGKTLLAEMLAAILEAARSLLIIPANLREKTYADRASYLGKWRLASPPPLLMSTSELTEASRQDFLAEYDPQVIIVDEGDELANPDSSVSRRLTRHTEERTREECAVFVMSGTPARKSLLGYAHQLKWCLREDGAPIPRNAEEARMWAAALDYESRPRMRRPGPGPLGHSRTAAVAWFQKRLAETPGVVIIDGDSAAGIPLTIRQRLAREDVKLDKHFRRFGVHQENPDGITVSDPLSRWKMDGDLGCGMYRRWNPPPPEEWREARRVFSKFVRDRIADSTRTSRPLDTEAQVSKRYADEPAVADWIDIGPTFKERTEPVWVSTSTLDSVRDWLRETTEPAIVWTGNVEFAHALSTATRLPYYGRDGRDQNGRPLHAAPAGHSMIVSWLANKKGFNLQAWRRALIVQPPQSAKWLEQTLGRHHRSGQDKPVTIDILVTSGGTLDAFESAIGEAGHAKRSVGLTQKILRAKIERVRPRVTDSNRFRWARKSDKGND